MNTIDFHKFLWVNTDNQTRIRDVDLPIREQILDYHYQIWKKKPISYRVRNPFARYFAGIMGRANDYSIIDLAHDYLINQER